MTNRISHLWSFHMKEPIVVISYEMTTDITCMHEKCYYICGHSIFMTQRYPLNNTDQDKVILYDILE